MLLDPVQVVGDIGVDRWEAFDAARLHAEAHDARQHPLELFIVVEHEWRTGVTLKRAEGEKENIFLLELKQLRFGDIMTNVTMSKRPKCRKGQNVKNLKCRKGQNVVSPKCRKIK